jgi:hypothetical protein
VAPERTEVIGMVQIIHLLTLAKMLPVSALILICATWIIIKLIRWTPDILMGCAEVIRAKKGK